jgi:signal peptidase I
LSSSSSHYHHRMLCPDRHGRRGGCGSSALSFSTLSSQHQQQQHASFFHWKSTIIALASSLPLLIWANDALFGLVRVNGQSMEPTLQHGDVVLVRKADGGYFIQAISHSIFGNAPDDNDGNDNNASWSLAREQSRIRHYEMAIHGYDFGNGNGNNGNNVHDVQLYGSTANIYENPPLVVAGQVVVLTSPETAFPSEYIIKRVVGVGGQWLLPLPPSTFYPKGSRRHYPIVQRMELLPPYTLYVQGDHPNNDSRDSRHYGPVSNNLLVGVAECVVWPPTRWQRIRRRDSNVDPNEDDDDADNDDAAGSRRRHMRRALWR